MLTKAGKTIQFTFFSDKSRRTARFSDPKVSFIIFDILKRRTVQDFGPFSFASPSSKRLSRPHSKRVVKTITDRPGAFRFRLKFPKSKIVLWSKVVSRKANFPKRSIHPFSSRLFGQSFSKLERARKKKINKNILLFLVYFNCYHITLYLAKKGCLVPVLIISSSLSSMHRTGLPVLKDTGFVNSPFCSDAWYKERTAREKTDQASTIAREWSSKTAWAFSYFSFRTKSHQNLKRDH